MDEQSLMDRLRKIEALMARPGTRGEGVAAAEAHRRLVERLSSIEKSEPLVEHRFSLPDAWSRRLFIALLRRYELQPYRYRGQRYSSVTVKAGSTFVEETLWPEFTQMSNVLREHLLDVTERVIAEVLRQKSRDVEEVG